MILTVTAFKNLFDIELDDLKIQNAIQVATGSFFNLISKKYQYKVQQQRTDELIQLQNWFPISRDLSIDISSKDMRLFEYDTDYNTIDNIDHIIGIQFIEIKNDNRLKLQYDILLPQTQAHQMILEYNISRLNPGAPDKIDNVRRYLALAAFNILGKDIIISLKQNGITDWNLNGVSVSVDGNGMQTLKENNESEMKEIYNIIMPFAIEPTYANRQWLGSRYGRY